jgi:hypothetical protein
VRQAGPGRSPDHRFSTRRFGVPAVARRAIAAVALAAVVLVMLVGCGSSGSHSSSGSPSGDGSGGGGGKGSSSSTTVAKPLPPATHTACTSAVYIGDSTSDGESDPEYVPNAKLRAPHQLRKVGVKHVHMEVSGARSIVETFEGIPNGASVAQSYADHGYHGCWILALGTNDSADLNAGSNVGLKERIHQMMSIIGDQPVMWVNVLSIDGAPEYYEETGMHHWDEDLVAACHRYPSMRVMNWASLAKHQWFIPDGVHYTTAGYEHRTKLIADALVKAFPRGRPASASCQVR